MTMPIHCGTALSQVLARAMVAGRITTTIPQSSSPWHASAPDHKQVVVTILSQGVLPGLHSICYHFSPANCIRSRRLSVTPTPVQHTSMPITLAHPAHAAHRTHRTHPAYQYAWVSLGLQCVGDIKRCECRHLPSPG